MPELRDLYDQNRQLTGETLVVDNPIPPQRYINVVLIFIQNSRGEFLIQRRTMQRNGLYATTGGHPKHGETSLQGAVTEVAEELGLNIAPEQLQLFYSGRSDEEQVFWDDYYIKLDADISDLELQTDEVASAHWFSAAQIHKLYEQDKFMPDHYDEFLRLQDWLKEK